MKLNFSVSMCVYGQDDPAHFETAVNSVVKQTSPPTEVVLVVDGPVSDGINLVIKKFESNSWFKVIRLAKNCGHGIARQVGFENCQYSLVALMDADDISESTRFSKQLRCFEKDEELTIVGGNISEFCGNLSNIVGRRIVPESDSEIKEYLKKRCPMNQVTVMFKRDDIEAVGGYIDWYCEEDYYLWVRLFLSGKKFLNLSDNLVNVRVDNEMYQRRGGWNYFRSELKLQLFMFQHQIIKIYRLLINIIERFIVQVLLPNKLRGFVFRLLARK